MRTFYEQGGKESSSEEDVRTSRCKKLTFFRNLWCVRTDKGEGGLNQCGQEGGQFFTFLYGLPCLKGGLHIGFAWWYFLSKERLFKRQK